MKKFLTAGHLKSVWAVRWVPARTSTLDTILATYALVVMALFRSWDYAVDETAMPESRLYRVTVLPIERAAPLWVWALGFGLAGMTLLVGKWFALHRVVWLGHAIGAIAYSAMLLGILGSVIPIWMWVNLWVAILGGAGLWRWTRNRRLVLLPSVINGVISAAVLLLTPDDIDGIRFGTVLILPTLMHWLLLIRMGWTPLTYEKSRTPVEVVTGPADAR